MFSAVEREVWYRQIFHRQIVGTVVTDVTHVWYCGGKTDV